MKWSIENVEDIRMAFVEKFKNNDFVILEDGTKTIEIDNAHFIADEDFIFKEPNYEYIARELKWYYTCDCNINSMDKPIPKIWEKISGKNGEINSNYGWCIFSKTNYYQFEYCLNELIRDSSSRRACMIYNRPSMHIDQHINGAQDFMCTYAVQCLIRDNVLIYTVLMRSNDAIWGYRNDYGWALNIANLLFDKLNAAGKNLKSFKIIWNAVSLHIYERDFKYIQEYDMKRRKFCSEEELTKVKEYIGQEKIESNTNCEQIFYSDI